MNASLAASNLAGRVAVVTGASRGIGQAIALELARLGATVVGTATSDAGAQRVTDTLRASGYSGRGVVMNVNDPEACDGVIEGIAGTEGAIGILVNNAGVTRDNLAIRMKNDEWFSVIDTNLSAVFRLSRAVMRSMMKVRWGRIVNVTSVVGSAGNPGQANYAAAKAGVAGMTRALARELGSRGVTVNCVAPGFIDTDMTRALDDAQRKALLQQIPLARLGQPADVAAAIGFLCSSEAGYITGTTIHVNGGMFMG